MSFDPYNQWFSIPPKDQPPDHYRLLGLTRFETNAEVISRAAEKRLEYLRTFQTGAEAKECERLRGEVEHARATLLEPHRKTVYDTLLRAASSADAAGRWAEPGKAGFLSVGQSIGRFKVLAVVRETALATTCTVEDPAAGRVYSLKMLSRQAAADERLRKRFDREVEISQRLNHPNLITGCEAGAYGKIPYLVSEHVIGTDLKTLVEKCGPFPVDQAIELVEQAACGLGQLHLLGVYHRNLSPRNLLLDVQSRVRVSNLLLAGIEEGSELDGDESLTRTGEAMGSSDFMAPEQAVDASAADQRADIYSLGCTLFYLLTGRLMYGGRGAMEKALAHRNNPIPSLEDNCPAAPAWLDRVFERMVAKQPEDRYASMAGVSGALASVRRARGPLIQGLSTGHIVAMAAISAVIVLALAAWIVGSSTRFTKMSQRAEVATDIYTPSKEESHAEVDQVRTAKTQAAAEPSVSQGRMENKAASAAATSGSTTPTQRETPTSNEQPSGSVRSGSASSHESEPPRRRVPDQSVTTKTQKGPSLRANVHDTETGMAASTKLTQAAVAGPTAKLQVAGESTVEPRKPVVDQQHGQTSANPGTAKKPVKTISTAAKPAQSGDTILIKPGLDRKATCAVAQGFRGRLMYSPDAFGNIVPDFSLAGYRNGGVALPVARVVETLKPERGSSDDSARIQAAIDRVAQASQRPDDGVRGAVLLSRGAYRCGTALRIPPGVTLRGEGQDTRGTVITATMVRAQADDQPTLIEMGGTSDDGPVVEGTGHKVLNEAVLLGERTLKIDGAASFQVGDAVIVDYQPNDEWIHALKMDQIERLQEHGKQWTAREYHSRWEAKVVSVDGESVTLDTPVINALERRYGSASLRKCSSDTRGRAAAVERLRLVSIYQLGKETSDENHAWTAIRIANVVDSWVREVTALHFAFGCVYVNHKAARITVQDCAVLDPVSEITGNRRYSFLGEGQYLLFQRCYARNGRHDFATSAHDMGPTVFLDCLAEETHNDIGPHHRWACGQLYDNVKGGQIHVQDRGQMGSGHGWAGNCQVLWNCEAPSLICQKPWISHAQNWAIGCIGSKGKPILPGRPEGWWESLGQHVAPRSLYLAQLKERIDRSGEDGNAALRAVITSEQRRGTVWDYLHRRFGNDR